MQNDSHWAKLTDDLHQKRKAALGRARNYIIDHTALTIEEPDTPENPLIAATTGGVHLYHHDIVLLVTWIDDLRKGKAG